MACANPFVKNELQESKVAYTPRDGFYNVLEPCHRCLTARSGTAWEYCMRQRRFCLRRNEEHALPTIRRVHVTNVRYFRNHAFGGSMVSSASDSNAIFEKKRAFNPKAPLWAPLAP